MSNLLGAPTQVSGSATARTAALNETADDADLRMALENTWRRPPGFLGWLTTTDHKEIGRRYITTAFIFFCLAGLLAVAIRLQLAVPRNTLLTNDQFNQFFSTH